MVNPQAAMSRVLGATVQLDVSLDTAGVFFSFSGGFRFAFFAKQCSKRCPFKGPATFSSDPKNHPLLRKHGDPAIAQAA